MKKAEDIIADILRREGGYVDHPADKGGSTNKGITLVTLRRYMPGATLDDLKSLTDAMALTIYSRLYVSPLAYVTGYGLKALMVDMAVNHGQENAERMLQAALGVKVDGDVGPMTLTALEMAGPDLYYKLLAERIKFYGRIISANHSQAVFASGWLNRCAEFLI
jgi:lysozyme family protein